MTATLQEAPPAPSATNGTAPAGEFRMLPLAKLQESIRNPRKHFDKKALEELTESVRRIGVLSPILARPKFWRENPNVGNEPLCYEIAAGHRRYRAAKAAGVKEVPVLVREMTDDQFLAVLIIENAQREDVHPLDEALGYQQLLELPGYDVPTIATKVGKSASFVYQRLKLVDLVPTAQRAFWAEKITAGHAILIARLQPKDQEQALRVVDDRYRGLLSVRELAAWIEREIHLDLQKAPFKVDDAGLVPAAGACTLCPKRTGFTPELFADIAKKDTCTDGTCYRGKLAALVARKKSELAAEGVKPIEISTEYHYGREKQKGVLQPGEYYEAKKTDPKAKLAVVVDGHGVGTAKYVTTERPSASGGGYNADTSTYQRQERARQAKAKQKARIRRAIVDAIVPKLPTNLAGAGELRLVIAGYVREMTQDKKKALCELQGWEGKKGQYNSWDFEKPIAAEVAKLDVPALSRLLCTLPLVGDLVTSTYDSSPATAILAAAKAHGVNAVAIERRVVAEARERSRAKAARIKPKAAKKRAGDVARQKKAKKAKAAAGKK